MKIYPVTHGKNDKNKWCGPAAISILTGMNTGEAARLLRIVNGGRPVKGTLDAHMGRALRLCNVSMRPIAHWYKDKKAPTLTQWLKDSVSLRTAGRVFVVAAGHHWQVITGRRYCCSMVQEIVGLKHEKVMRRARVEAVYEISVARSQKIEIPSAARKTKPVVDPSYASLRKLLKANGLKGRVVRDGGWEDFVIPKCETFPDGLTTYHNGDWCETLDRIETCLDDPSLVFRGYYGR